MNKPAQLSAERQKLLAQRLKGVAKARTEVPRQIPQRDPAVPAPLSIGQHQMWVIDQMTPGNPAYNIPVAYRIHGDLDVRSLETSFNQVIARHEIWRTTFRELDGEGIQEIHPEYRIQIEVTDLMTWPSEDRENKARALAAEESVRPFDLTALPLVRVSLYRVGTTEHVLLVNLHHIVGDGLSLNLMFDELDAFYRAATSGASATLPELPVQHADFSAWQRAELSKPQYASQLEYWKTQLGGDLPVLEIPTDKVRPVRQSFQGSNINFTLPQALAQGITQVGAQGQATFFAAALAAFQVLLMRYSRGEDIIIGMPVANRPLPETETLIGNFINVVALRGDLSGNPTFLEQLRRTRETTLNAMSNKDVPFDAVVKSQHTHRDPSRNPVFQALMQVLPSVRVRLGNLTLSRFEYEVRIAQVDLTLHLYEETDSSYHGQIQYCTDLFMPGTIERLARNFVQLLQEIVRDPQQKIWDIPLISESEKKDLLQTWNDTAVDYPSEATLQSIFERQAAATPGEIAVEFSNLQLTYRELDQRANRLARHLQSLGLSPGDCAGICMERSLESIVGILGILKAGGAYVPIDAAAPADRVALMLEESRSVLVLARTSTLAQVSKTTIRVVDFDHLDLSTQDDQPLGLGKDGGDLAYVIFTSGSTGKPKGVAVPHRGISRLVIQGDYVRFGPEEIVAHASNVAFDAATFEIWGALLNGGRLVIVPREVLLSTSDFATFLTRYRVSTLFLTTSLFNQIAMESPAIFRPLRNVVFGGEAGNPDCVRNVLNHGAPQRLVNGYGPTETTTFAICHVVRELPADAVSVPIGRPIANTTAYILDPQLQLVPCGALGEIYLGGPGLALGYINDPELTTQRFLQTSYGRLYRTGDLARHRDDGLIEYCGRTDSQLKLRGFRVEPGEIETSLQHHRGIRHAAVVAGAAQTLIAYLVSAGGGHPLAAELREFLASELPSYMIPSAFVWLDSLPLTRNGKLDVRALPAPTLDEETTKGYVAPRTDLEKQLVVIWEEVLGRNPVGVQDDFFEIGGHSLLAARVIATVSKRLGETLNFGTFFNQPTIEEHARGLQATKTPDFQAPFTVINASGHQTPVFFFHGDLLGGGLFCKTLANAIGNDRPFYVVTPHGVDGGEIPPTVEDMAAERVKWIREIQPHGPYILGGYCNGALIAYHTARILREAGEQVPAVLMLSTDGSNVRFRLLKRLMAVDSAARGEDPAATRRRFLRLRNRLCDLESIRCYYVNAAVDLSKQPFPVQVSRLWRKSRRILRRLAPSALVNLARSVVAPDNTPIPPRHKEAIVNVYDDITRVHIPAEYESPVYLFWPESEPPATSNGPADGWEKLCSHLELVHVPGDHTSCVALNANVVLVGEAMRKSIQKAESLLKERLS